MVQENRNLVNPDDDDLFDFLFYFFYISNALIRTN